MQTMVGSKERREKAQQKKRVELQVQQQQTDTVDSRELDGENSNNAVSADDEFIDSIGRDLKRDFEQAFDDMNDL